MLSSEEHKGLDFISQPKGKKKKQFGGPFFMESVKIIRGEDKLPATRLHEVMEVK